MERDHNNIPVPGADRTGSNRFKDTGDEKETQSVREANENCRDGQGDDATETRNGRRGNRPRFDRDR
jgi:hypothetical protein